MWLTPKFPKNPGMFRLYLSLSFAKLLFVRCLLKINSTIDLSFSIRSLIYGTVQSLKAAFASVVLKISKMYLENMVLISKFTKIKCAAEMFSRELFQIFIRLVFMPMSRQNCLGYWNAFSRNNLISVFQSNLLSYERFTGFPMHKKWSFPLRVSPVNVTISAGNQCSVL